MGRLLILVVWVWIYVAQALAVVDVNLATAQELQQLKGLGPKLADLIVRERTESGAFLSSTDMLARVKGLGHKRLQSLLEQGLQISKSSHHATPKVIYPRLIKPKRE